jgi:transcription antitermination factor NusG
MEASGLDLSRCIGKLVKVVFQEEPGARVEVRKGVLAGFDGEFVQLESNQNVHVISRRHIISLKVFGGGKGG